MLERRSGVLVHTRRLENVSAIDQLAAQVAGLAADAHHLLGIPVVRLQLIVSHTPVLHRQIRRQTRRSVLFDQMRSQSEYTRQEAEAHPRPMLARAAHAGSR